MNNDSNISNNNLLEDNEKVDVLAHNFYETYDSGQTCNEVMFSNTRGNRVCEITLVYE